MYKNGKTILDTYMDKVKGLLAFGKTPKGIKMVGEALLGQSQEASKTPSLRLL